MEEIPKLTLPEVAQRINLVRDGRPLVLTLTVGKRDFYRLQGDLMRSRRSPSSEILSW